MAARLIWAGVGAVLCAVLRYRPESGLAHHERALRRSDPKAELATANALARMLEESRERAARGARRA